MMMALLLETALFLFVYGVEGQVECHDAYECASSTITTSECYGYHSCAKSVISSGNLDCYGSYSCFNSTLSDPISLSCQGLYSCAYSHQDSYSSIVFCRGEKSCIHTDTKWQATVGQLICDGLHSCSNTNYTSARYPSNSGSVSVRGALAGYNSIFYAPWSSSFVFAGHNAGYNAQIICANNDCSLTCWSGGCNNLKFACAGYNPNCTLNSITCYGAHKTIYCPDGYELPSPYEFPSLLDLEFSTYDNSIKTCDPSITNALNCDDYQDQVCYNNGPLSNTAPICCTAVNSCRFADDIITTIDINDNNNYDTSFRSDGWYSSDDINGSIYAVNGGNMYFSGGYTSYGSDTTTTIINNGNYDIIASGYAALYNNFPGHVIIDNINNLYCLTPFSCGSVTVSNLNGNVYAYGWRCAEGISINNIEGDIYCSSTTACGGMDAINVNGDILGIGDGIMAYSLLKNVQGSIIGYGDDGAIQVSSLVNITGDIKAKGYRALYDGEIVYAQTVICDGDECLAESVLWGLTRVEVSGNQALSNTLIRSEAHDRGNYLTVIIDGINDERGDIYCSENDICDIICLSENSCAEIYLECIGTCVVTCDQDNGFNCPYVFTDEPTEEPTEEPL